jgi:hypothetical protein
MELDWYCTGMLGIGHQSCLGILWSLKRLLSSLGKQRNPCQDVWFLIVNIQANRISNVSSVITKIFNPYKYWTVTSQPFIKHLVIQCLFCLLSVYCSNVVRFSVSFVWFSVFFCSISCSTIQCFSVLILELYSRYFEPHKQQPSGSQ